MDNQEVKEIICRQNRLNNIPGEIFGYSNSNYILLALIVEKVSGMPFAEFTNDFILRPAGMKHSLWRTDYKKTISSKSLAYKVKNASFLVDMPDNNIHGSGGLLTTAEDLIKWTEFYLNAKVGGDDFLARQTGLDTLNGGDLNTYAAGLFVSGGKGKRVFQHGGATAAYRAKLICLPDAGISVAWLSNTSMLDTTGSDPAMDVARILVSPSYFESAHKSEHKTYSDSNYNKLAAYAGLYKSSHSEREVRLEMGAKGLEMAGTALGRASKTKFFFYDIEFSFGADGQLTITPPSSEPMRYHLTDPAGSAIPQKGYLGSYYSGEARAAIKIVSVNGKLMAQFKSGDECELVNHFKDGFVTLCDLKTDVLFMRDKHGKVISLDVSTQRAAHIKFVKQVGKQ